MWMARFVRFCLGIAWLGVTVVGVVALVNGAWLSLVAAVAVWWVVGTGFSLVERGVDHGEVVSTQQLLDDVSLAVAVGDWGAAEAQSTQAVDRLERAARRSTADTMSGPLAVALVNHAVVQGANDHLRAARASIDRAQTLLRRVDAPDHAVSAIRAEADEIWRRLHAPDAHPGVLSDYCRDKAASLNVA